MVIRKKEAIRVSGQYIDKTMIISIIFIFITAMSILFIVWKVMKKQKFFSGWIVYLLIFIVIVSTFMSIKIARDNGIIEDRFWDLISNYKANGFSYSFLSTIEASKRKKPDNYNEDIEAYQLSTKILNLLNLSDGIMQNIHNTFKDDADYLDSLNILQYDILFGKHYYLEGQYPFEKVNTKLGIREISVKDKYVENGDLIVKGENFTGSSRIFVKSKMYDTVLIDNTELRVIGFDDDINLVSVNQVAGQAGRNNKILGNRE